MERYALEEWEINVNELKKVLEKHYDIKIEEVMGLIVSDGKNKEWVGAGWGGELNILMRVKNKIKTNAKNDYNDR